MRTATTKAIHLIFIIIIAGTLAYAETLTGKVVAIADGDTLTVLDASNAERKIRLNGIDSPELGQAFGQAAKRNLSALVFGKVVAVEWRKVDRYGRLVGTITRDGVDLNLEQLRAGLAWYFVKYEGDVPAANRKPYAEAEKAAREARRGLWADASPVAPWLYRHPEQAADSSSNASSSTTITNGRATAATSSSATAGKIIGNKNSGIFHAPNCPDYLKVSERNRVQFSSEADAVKAGYRKARNCL